MADISTQYAGLKLPSPLIVASSGLTSKLDKLLECEEAGAGAVVLKSIFEEQMEQEAAQMGQECDYPEAMDYLRHYVSQNALDAHLSLIREASSRLSIPVIASINCYKSDTWIDYARKIEEAGASALELNVMRIDADPSLPAGHPELLLKKMVTEVASHLSIPLIVKLSKYFTNVTALAHDLQIAGASGVVLFNRTYMPDINIHKEEVVSGDVFSAPSDLLDSLRYIALVRGALPDLSISLSTGARKGEDLVKGLLAGADAVQLCTALYRGGLDVIRQCNSFLREWMEEKKYESLGEFRSRLAAHSPQQATMYARSQFMKVFASQDPSTSHLVDVPLDPHNLEY